VYNNEVKKLGSHKDKFQDKWEYVINIYFGDDRILKVTSDDGNCHEKLLCRQGKIRVFHPLMNQMLEHEKIPSEIPRKKHLAMSIRQGMIWKPPHYQIPV